MDDLKPNHTFWKFIGKANNRFKGLFCRKMIDFEWLGRICWLE